MLDKVVFLGRGVAAVLASVVVCRRVRALSGSPRARECQPVSSGPCRLRRLVRRGRGGCPEQINVAVWP